MKLLKSEWPWWCLFLLAGVFTLKASSHWPWLGLAAAAPPVVIAFALLAWFDRLVPLGARIWVRAIGWGMLVATFIATYTHLYVQIWVEDLVVSSGRFDPGHDVALAGIASSVLSAPLAEEGLKGMCLLVLMWSRTRPVMGPWHGMLAGGLAALSFGFMENGLSFARSARVAGAPGYLEMVWETRSLFPFLHMLFSLPMAFAIGLAALLPTISRRLAAIVIGWLVSVTFHGLWNWEVILGKTDYSVAPWIGHAAGASPFLIVLFLGTAYWLESRSLESYGLPAAKPFWWPRRADPLKVRRALLRRQAQHLRRTPEQRQELARQQAAAH